MMTPKVVAAMLKEMAKELEKDGDWYVVKCEQNAFLPLCAKGKKATEHWTLVLRLKRGNRSEE